MTRLCLFSFLSSFLSFSLSRLAQRQAQQAKVAAASQEKLSAYQQKEKEKMQGLLNSLGLADKYPMK